MHVAALGDSKTWPTCASTVLPTYTFINNLQEEIFDLVATIRLDKCGGTTRHLRLVMSLPEFALLVPAHPIFPREAYPGEVDYLLPTVATTVNQHTERRLENNAKLHVFELEQMIKE